MTTVTINPFSAVGPVKPMNAVNNGPVVARSEQSRGNFADFRGGVIFPGGMILEDDGEVKIYYGAADTVECLATVHLADLLAAVEPFGKTA